MSYSNDIGNYIFDTNLTFKNIKYNDLIKMFFHFFFTKIPFKENKQLIWFITKR